MIMRLLVLYLTLSSVAAFQPNSRAASPQTVAITTTQRKTVSSWNHPLATSVIPAFLACAIAVTPAQAVDSSVFNHEYADPFHPYCERKIEVAKDGKTFHYSGTAVGPKGDDGPLRGCSPQEIKQYTLRQGSFDGDILDDLRISAGDGIHEGVWEPKNTANTNLGYEDVDGIRWNDGNKWIVKSQSRVVKNGEGKYVVEKKPTTVIVGEFIFYSYLGASTLAGVKGVVDAIKRRQSEAV